jgi:hypothetical protein
MQMDTDKDTHTIIHMDTHKPIYTTLICTIHRQQISPDTHTEMNTCNRLAYKDTHTHH